MGAYSKQLIAELTENLDPIIATFFDETKDDVAARVQELCRKHPLYE